MVHDSKKYKPYKNNMYAMTVESKKGYARNSLIGDIFPGSLNYLEKMVFLIMHSFLTSLV